ncbi:hypothetical protein C8Q80DRAFT_1347464 [Daedaleopsis nitida]|nr:hypothetical protein C8Q80DRAFT_1347464 [Daedaleopsis nitida]
MPKSATRKSRKIALARVTFKTGCGADFYGRTEKGGFRKKTIAELRPLIEKWEREHSFLPGSEVKDHDVSIVEPVSLTDRRRAQAIEKRHPTSFVVAVTHPEEDYEEILVNIPRTWVDALGNANEGIVRAGDSEKVNSFRAYEDKHVTPAAPSPNIRKKAEFVLAWILLFFANLVLLMTKAVTPAPKARTYEVLEERMVKTGPVDMVKKTPQVQSSNKRMRMTVDAGVKVQKAKSSSSKHRRSAKSKGANAQQTRTALATIGNISL